MHSDKKLSKEDTWRPADLRRHIREEGHGDDQVRRRDDRDRKHRGGESIERRYRDPEKEPRRERDKPSARERRDDNEKDRYSDRRKEGSRDRRGDKERDRRDDKEKRRERDKLVDGKRYDGDYKRQGSEGKHERERHRDKEKERERHRERPNEEDRDKRREGEDKDRRREERERHRERPNEEDRDKRREGEDKDRRREERERHRERPNEEDRDKRREGEDKDRRREERERHRERPNEEDRDKRREGEDKDRRREEWEREHRSERERRRHGESGEGERDRMERNEREKRDRRHKDEDKRSDKERRERHGDRKHLEVKEERARKEEERRQREERDRRHKDRGYHDEKKTRDNESREHRDSSLRGDRERAERDKNRERRRREEEEPEKKSAPEKSHEHETKTEVANDEDVVDQEYEDDFEDYEEDFEEVDESANEGEDETETQHPDVGEEVEEVTVQRRREIEAIQRAMNEENERVGTAQSRQIPSREEEERPKLSREKNPIRASQQGKFIDFVAAKQREISKKVSTKQKKRSTELLRLIDLDFSMSVSLLDLPPVSEYDMYIRTFGAANTKQAYVQCNEDNADRDIQTEEIEVCEKWTQHPPEHKGACGDPNISQEARDSEMNFDSRRLTAFLRSASQVMVVLLEEDGAERKSLSKLRSQTDMPSFSNGSLQLNTKLPFLYGRHIKLVHFSQVQKHAMMSVHSPTTKPSAVRLDSCTIICIWNIWEPSRPQKVLVYESEVQCCCFSPGKAILVFAGTSVGSVVLWDLREHASDHYHMKIGEDEWTFRQPTFSTDAVMAGSGHFSSVTSVEVVPSAVAGGLRPKVALLASEEESSGLSFQLASLDEIGVLNFWVVVQLPKANEAGSLTDLGLRPGGKVKLLHSSHLLPAERASPRGAAKSGPLQTFQLKILPTDSNHFFIGTNMGLVTHETSHSLKAPPKFYRFQEAGVRPVDVTSIHFSPFKPHFFLVGCGDGCIRLHEVSDERPVAQWKNSTAGVPVVSVQWAQTRPAVFCVLDAASRLHIWDLMKTEAEPVITESMDSDRVTAMAVFGDSGQQNTYSGIALAHESGTLEMQYFARNLTVAILAEEEKLESMLTEAF